MAKPPELMGRGAFIAGSLVAESGHEKTVEHLVQTGRGSRVCGAHERPGARTPRLRRLLAKALVVG